MTPPEPGAERQETTRDEYLAGMLGDMDPLKHVGEGQFSTDEYFPQDIAHNPHLLAEVLNPGDPYPRPVIRRRK